MCAAQRAFPFEVGFKLPLRWREEQERGALPPQPEGGLYELLRRNGVAYCEFSVGPCVEAEEVALVKAEAAACASAGMGVSLHPYLAGSYGPALFGEHESVLRAMDGIFDAASTAAVITGREVVVVLHPATASFGADEDAPALRGRLVERSRAFFGAVAERAARSGPLVHPVAEHQVPPGADERLVRVGDTYEELMRVVDGLAIGLCFDTGHYILGVLRHGQAPRPPVEFLGRVEAVHLHAVEGETDHRLITPGSATLKEHLVGLLATGFSGGVTLEYSAQAMKQAGTFASVVDQSVRALDAWLGC